MSVALVAILVVLVDMLERFDAIAEAFVVPFMVFASIIPPLAEGIPHPTIPETVRISAALIAPVV